jgi:hypothetical protein
MVRDRICMYDRVCVCVCMCVCVCVYVYIHMYSVCVCVCVCVCVYIQQLDTAVPKEETSTLDSVGGVVKGCDVCPTCICIHVCM